MSKPDTWMPLFIGDYLADTQHLTRDEHGAYLLLIMAYWRTGLPLPDDDKRLGAIAKASSKEWKALRPVMAAFFHIESGSWKHGRIDSELHGAMTNSGKRVERAKAAAAKRWGNHCGHLVDKDASSNAPSNAPSIPQAMLVDCPSPSPSPKPLESAVVKSTTVSPAEEICARLAKAGIKTGNPEDPRLVAALASGLTVDEIAAIGPEAKAGGKGFAWILATAAGRRRDAEAMPNKPPNGSAAHGLLTNEATWAEGKRLGIQARPGEDWQQFRARIQAKAGVDP